MKVLLQPLLEHHSAATISALSLTFFFFFAKYVVFIKPVISIINNYSLIETQVNKLPYVKSKGGKNVIHAHWAL